ncbi:hypothetical protein DFH08DRAFT_951169 [Mycena albidolilacea]|uniref:Uncharacterized protein n=1 Tax=Mycena albidolilacea TaxID=1033008 RepID=A0AAD7F1G7_9AGAR|nr:hypothetical protein DFH08DRAFT_951169 [Mycena albidolilacea]
MSFMVKDMAIWWAERHVLIATYHLCIVDTNCPLSTSWDVDSLSAAIREQWGLALEQHEFWSTAVQIFDPHNGYAHFGWIAARAPANSDDSSSPAPAATRAFSYRHFLGLLTYSCLPCRVSTLRIGHVTLCREHASVAERSNIRRILLSGGARWCGGCIVNGELGWGGADEEEGGRWQVSCGLSGERVPPSCLPRLRSCVSLSYHCVVPPPIQSLICLIWGVCPYMYSRVDGKPLVQLLRAVLTEIEISQLLTESSREAGIDPVKSRFPGTLEDAEDHNPNKVFCY